MFSVNSDFNIDNIKVADWIFIDIDSEFVPFQIESLIIKSDDSFIAKLKDISTDKANKYNGLSIYLPESKLLTGIKKLNSDSIIGFEVIDKVLGNIGILEEIISKTGQDLLEVSFKDKKILIPVNENIILKIDHKKKLVKIDAPEGLIDLYLNA